MKALTRLARKLLVPLVTALGLVLAGPTTAPAQPFLSEAAPNRVIYLPKDKSLSFRLDRPAAKIVIAQPDIAEIVATTDQSFYLRGVDFGSTNLLVYGPGGRLQQVIDVRVGYDAQSLEQDLRAALPKETIEVRNLGEGLLLTGDVSNTAAETRAMDIAKRFAPDAITNALSVRASQQVILEVRVLEAGRSALQDLGVNLNIGNTSFDVSSGAGLTGGSLPASVISILGGVGRTNLDVQLQALEQKGIVRTLARPNLVALSGQKASFLAGGEFPFPVPSRDGITVEFRPYGVKLDFQPTVDNNGLIRLLVEPEVSQLDTTNSLRLSGFTIPALTVRRAKTTVELKDGDSFAVAGLFQRDYVNSMTQTPLLGDIPVLGALFRSARWRRAETELVIIITPRLATAADLSKPPIDALPGREPSALGMFLGGQVLDRPLARDNRPPGT